MPDFNLRLRALLLFGVALGAVVLPAVAGAYTLTVLYRFAGGKDGSAPYAGVIADQTGNPFGTTFEGGGGCKKKDGCGTVFKLAPDGTEAVLYAAAASGQAYDGVSPLFGSTFGGGTGGTIFSVAPGSSKKWTEQVLYSFCSQTNCADGSGPDTPLIIDTSGNIYGTTQTGGENKQGVVFELIPNGSVYSEDVLYSFCAQGNCADGAEPEGGVVFDANGNLFGTTAGDGSENDGLIFELSGAESSWQFNVLGNFDGTNGRAPLGSLLLDSDGKLFGTTATGGSDLGGNVFAYNGSIESLYSFCSQKNCRDGTRPSSGVIEDASGNLYGVTPEGGAHKGGTIFELSPTPRRI